MKHYEGKLETVNEWGKMCECGTYLQCNNLMEGSIIICGECGMIHRITDNYIFYEDTLDLDCSESDCVLITLPDYTKVEVDLEVMRIVGTTEILAGNMCTLVLCEDDKKDILESHRENWLSHK